MKFISTKPSLNLPSFSILCRTRDRSILASCPGARHPDTAVSHSRRISSSLETTNGSTLPSWRRISLLPSPRSVLRENFAFLQFLRRCHERLPPRLPSHRLWLVRPRRRVLSLFADFHSAWEICSISYPDNTRDYHEKIMSMILTLLVSMNAW